MLEAVCRSRYIYQTCAALFAYITICFNTLLVLVHLYFCRDFPIPLHVFYYTFRAIFVTFTALFHYVHRDWPKDSKEISYTFTALFIFLHLYSCYSILIT